VQVQLYQAHHRDQAIVATLKKEYIDCYQSIGINRTPEDAKNALAAANPDKKLKQAVWFYFIRFLFC
jgi:hypothetical protein